MDLDLTIFIPTYKRTVLLQSCIKSIRRSLCNSEIRYEILIVNESTVALNLTNEDVIIFNPKKELMPCEAMYVALLNAKGKYFLRIDDDNEINSDLVSSLYNYISNHRDVAYCGALGIREDGTISNPGTIFSKTFKFSLRKRIIGFNEYDVDVVDNVYIMNPGLIDLNNFHLSCKFFPWSFEDGYDQLRLKKNYKIMVLPTAKTIHHIHSNGLNLKQIYHYGRSKFLMYRNIFKFPYLKSLVLCLISSLLIPYIYSTDKPNIRELLLAYRHYIKGLKDGIKFMKKNESVELFRDK